MYLLYTIVVILQTDLETRRKVRLEIGAIDFRPGCIQISLLGTQLSPDLLTKAQSDQQL